MPKVLSGLLSDKGFLYGFSENCLLAVFSDGRQRTEEEDCHVCFNKGTYTHHDQRSTNLPQAGETVIALGISTSYEFEKKTII